MPPVRQTIKTKIANWINTHQPLIRIIQNGHPLNGFYCSKKWFEENKNNIIWVEDMTNGYWKSKLPFLNK